jgi:outer membrane protein OmpA-like peptidoglycan-associated protein
MRAWLPVLVVSCVVSPLAVAQPKTVTEDKAWATTPVALRDTLEAEFIVRLGDVDNLGFGWPEGFDPFCGRMTEAHAYPWDPPAKDVAGLDRILLSSKFKASANGGCSADGYSGSFDAKKTRPVALKLPLASLKGATVRDAALQLFIDDFQAPSMCSRFVVTLNGRRFAEAERLLNAIDQSGPVGKLVTLPLPEEFFADLVGKPELVLLVDEAKGAADGFALDFVRLLVNRKRENTCRGDVVGRVQDKETGDALAGARVWLADKTSVVTDAEGRFSLKGVPTGFEVVSASAPGYADGSAGADVGQGSENPEVLLELAKGRALEFAGQQLQVGERLELKSVLFDQGKAELKKTSTPELDKLVAFLQANPGAEIELSGHTSSEGDAAGNRSLSYRRVKACRDYVVQKGIDAGRIVAVGHGPDLPVAPNDTEANRKLNRRVELRVVRDGG